MAKRTTANQSQSPIVKPKANTSAKNSRISISELEFAQKVLEEKMEKKRFNEHYQKTDK